MKKIFLTLISLFFLTTILSAQKLELGFIGSYQHTFPYATVGGVNNKIDFEPRSGAGFNVGGYFNWYFYKNLGFDFQLLYALRSYAFNMKLHTDTVTVLKRNVYNVELPLHFNYRFKVKDNICVAPVIGASLNLSAHGKDVAYEDTDIKKPVDRETSNSDLFGKDGRMYRFEVSPEIGMLVKYRDFGFRALYSVGVTNLTRSGYGWSYNLLQGQSKYLFNRELKLSFIYTFKIK